MARYRYSKPASDSTAVVSERELAMVNLLYELPDIIFVPVDERCTLQITARC